MVEQSGDETKLVDRIAQLKQLSMRLSDDQLDHEALRKLTRQCAELAGEATAELETLLRQVDDQTDR